MQPAQLNNLVCVPQLSLQHVRYGGLSNEGSSHCEGGFAVDKEGQ